MSKNSASKGSIKRKLTVIPLILVFVAISTLGVTSYFIIRDSLMRQVEVAGYQLAEQVASAIQHNNQSLELMNNMLEDRLRVAGRIVARNQSN